MNKDIIREPLLRFPGFDDEWKEIKLRELINEKYISIQGSGVDEFNGFKKYINTGAVENSRINDAQKIDYKNRPSRANIQPKINTVYIAKMADTSKVLYFNKKNISNYILSTGFLGVELIHGVNLNYFNTLIDTEYFIYQKNLFSCGTTQIAINNRNFKHIKIPLPSLEEQSKIGSFFKTLDSLIENQESYIDKLEKEKKGLLQDIFSRGLRLLDEYGERFEGEWREVKLGEVIELKNGYGFKAKDYKNNKYGDYKIVNIGVVNNSDKYIKEIKEPLYTKMPNDIRNHQILKCGDFLISMTGDVGKISIVNTENLLLNQRVGLIKILDKKLSEIDVEYFYYCLMENSVQNQLNLFAEGSSQKNLSQSDIYITKIQLPSLEEQKVIGSFFKKIDRKIEKEKELLEKYREMKQGLLQDMFI